MGGKLKYEVGGRPNKFLEVGHVLIREALVILPCSIGKPAGNVVKTVFSIRPLYINLHSTVKPHVRVNNLGAIVESHERIHHALPPPLLSSSNVADGGPLAHYAPFRSRLHPPPNRTPGRFAEKQPPGHHFVRGATLVIAWDSLRAHPTRAGSGRGRQAWQRARRWEARSSPPSHGP